MPSYLKGPSFKNRRIGLLGGSFNPAHDGHRAVSIYALKRLNLHQIWWLVSPQNPLKSKQDMLSYSGRVTEARKVARHSKIVVSTLEKSIGKNYSVDTLQFLRKRYSGTHFIWLMGADNLLQIPGWHQWRKLFSLVPVAVFRRPSYGVGRRRGKAAQRYDRAWTSVRSARSLAAKKTPVWLILDNPLNYLSATKIRGEKKTWLEQN